MTVVPEIIAVVRCYAVKPGTITPRNRDHLLIGLHHGGFVFEAAESGTLESILMAGLGRVKVITVDYRLLPDHPFPAAIDDAMAVWREITAWMNPGNIGVFGSSAGGSLALSLVQRALREGVPVPGAIMCGSPWCDLSKTGDSYYTNDGIDGPHRYDGFWHEVAKLYAHGRDLRDPQVSPVYGEFRGFPPTFLVSGTRDLYLSNTVRVHGRLLQAQVPTQLEVHEGQPHMFYLGAALFDAPEGTEFYTRVSRFFDAHLGQ